jgi:hypothetical protein
MQYYLNVTVLNKNMQKYIILPKKNVFFCYCINSHFILVLCVYCTIYPDIHGDQAVHVYSSPSRITVEVDLIAIL